ncbi:MAG: aminomethyltransferase family protein, partial [Pseudomonadota bacterium]
QLGANRAPKTGRIGLTHALTPAGGVAAEFSVAMLSHTCAYLTSAAAAEEMDNDLLRARSSGMDVEIANRTEDLSVIGLMGPKSRNVLATLTQDELGSWLSVREITLAGKQVRALRVSYVGELGWELHVARDEAVAVFEALDVAGRPYGIGLYGAYAANAMRLEKGYRAWGSDLTTERSPLEAGLGYLVRHEGRDFVGRDAMLARQEAAPWDMVLLEIEAGDVDPFYAHGLWQGARSVGVVTSGAYGHRTGKVLALAYLRDATAREGLSVDILGQRRVARILDHPPYDPENERMNQ